MQCSSMNLTFLLVAIVSLLFFVGANDSPSKLVSLAMKLPIYCFMTVILLSLMLIWYYKYWVHFPGGEARDVYDPISCMAIYVHIPIFL